MLSRVLNAPAVDHKNHYTERFEGCDDDMISSIRK